MMSDQQRILNHSIPEPNSGCWLWIGGMTNAGYGVCGSEKKKTVSAHRLAYSVFKCEIPDGKIVAHSCDNRLCVNPEHLWLATHKQNSQDMVTKNRSAKGERCGKSKLTNEQICFIRNSDLSHRELGRIFNVSHANVGYIKRNATWN
jgi:HNH endonuclease